MERIYRGNIPTDGTLIDTNGDWGIYQRGSKDAAFGNFKMVSHAPRPKKANFHLGYYIKEKKLARTHDAKMLQQNYPLLYEWVMVVLVRRYTTVIQDA